MGLSYCFFKLLFQSVDFQLLWIKYDIYVKYVIEIYAT
jgi:hypothetical protein